MRSGFVHTATFMPCLERDILKFDHSQKMAVIVSARNLLAVVLEAKGPFEKKINVSFLLCRWSGC